MTSRRLPYGLFIAQCLAIVWAESGASSEFYALRRGPPAVAVVDASKLTVTATVPLEGTLLSAVIDRTNSRIYGLHDPPGRGLAAAVSVTDVAARTVCAKIKRSPFVAGAIHRRFLAWVKLDPRDPWLLWSNDRRILVCASLHGLRSFSGWATGPYSQGSAVAALVIDPSKDEITAIRPSGRPTSATLFTPDASRFFFVNLPESADKKRGLPARKPSITTFSREDEKPLAEVEVARVSSAVLSPDGRWLYALDPGNPSKNPKRHREASVAVIDVETGKLAATHHVGARPRELSSDLDTGQVTLFAQLALKGVTTRLCVFRGKEAPTEVEAGEEAAGLRPLGRDGTRVVLARDSLRFIDREGNLLRTAVPLNPPKGAQRLSKVTYAGGKPGELLALPRRDRLVISLLQKNGQPTGRVAIVNLKDNTVAKVVTTGRGGIRLAKKTLEVVHHTAATFSAFADPANSHLYMHGVYNRPAPNLHIAAGPDGKFVYAFNAQTGDITVIATEDGAMPRKIAFHNCEYVRALPGGKYMVARNPGHVLLISTESHQSVEHRVPGGFRSLHVFRDSPRMVALTKEGLMMWDTESGTLLGAVSLPEPAFLVEPETADK